MKLNSDSGRVANTRRWSDEMIKAPFCYSRASTGEVRRVLMKKLILAFVCLSIPVSVMASELIYTPVNPSFGGNPLNGSVLLNEAQAINKHKDPASQLNRRVQKTALEKFNDQLQQFVLNRVASSVTTSIISNTGQLIPGTIQTQDFTITVVALGGGVMQITTTDNTTGQATIFQVNSGI